MCGSFGLKSSGTKAELIDPAGRVLRRPDVRGAGDEGRAGGVVRDYELLAGRAYAELRAKKVITQGPGDPEPVRGGDGVPVRGPAEGALRPEPDGQPGRRAAAAWTQTSACCGTASRSRPRSTCRTIWTASSTGYLRKERGGRDGSRSAFLVIGPSFTPQSMRLANQYKARTNWDVALVHGGRR